MKKDFEKGEYIYYTDARAAGEEIWFNDFNHHNKNIEDILLKYKVKLRDCAYNFMEIHMDRAKEIAGKRSVLHMGVAKNYFTRLEGWILACKNKASGMRGGFFSGKSNLEKAILDFRDIKAKIEEIGRYYENYRDDPRDIDKRDDSMY